MELRVNTLALPKPLAPQSRLIIVGDVHGCADQLDALMAKCRFDVAADTLILAGDLVNKGPESGRVVAFAMDVGAHGVMGNHELKVLDAWRNAREGKKVKKKLAATLNSLTEAQLAYLERLPHALVVPEANVVVVHAGMDPSVPLEKQDPMNLMHMRVINKKGCPSERGGKGDVPWASTWNGTDTVVFGHDAGRGLQQYEKAIGLDTGCVKGRQLTALVYPGAELVSVDGWKDPEGAASDSD